MVAGFIALAAPRVPNPPVVPAAGVELPNRLGCEEVVAGVDVTDPNNPPVVVAGLVPELKENIGVLIY